MTGNMETASGLGAELRTASAILSDDTVEALVRAHYGLEGRAEWLWGEKDSNHRLTPCRQQGAVGQGAQSGGTGPHHGPALPGAAACRPPRSRHSRPADRARPDRCARYPPFRSALHDPVRPPAGVARRDLSERSGAQLRAPFACTKAQYRRHAGADAAGAGKLRSPRRVSHHHLGHGARAS